MYRKSWRYFRNAGLLWLFISLIFVSAAYSLNHPAFWAVTLLLWLIQNPFRNAFVFAHPFRRIRWMKDTRLDFQELTFESRDGLTLFGRFLPSKNGATIILLHGLGSTNNEMLLYAEFLSDAGYGIFMIDLRAHGSSDGDTSTYGLNEANDVAGAVDFLSSRTDVNTARIGVFGISLGAQAALRGALISENIRALVLEGLNPARLDDHGGRPTSLIRWLNYPTNWLYYKFYHFMIGDKDTRVLDVIGNIAPRPIFFIAAGAKDIYFNRHFFEAANEPKEIWELPHGQHGAAILHDSTTYMHRVIAFFNKELS